MGYNTNGYNVYRETGVKTASQGKLVVMLYEEAVRQLEKAISLIKDNSFIEPQQIENFGNSLQKVEDIITELQVSLDMEKGGEIAKNLMALYLYFNKELVAATINHDKKKLTFILNMLSQLRDSWISAASSTANTETKLPPDRPTLNITG
jgi:flagellar biosynthetic protein FliS